MDSQRPNDVSPEAMQSRIQQARREAEGLKDRIKRKKDELADTSRKSNPFCSRSCRHFTAIASHAASSHHLCNSIAVQTSQTRQPLGDLAMRLINCSGDGLIPFDS